MTLGSELTDVVEGRVRPWICVIFSVAEVRVDSNFALLWPESASVSMEHLVNWEWLFFRAKLPSMLQFMKLIATYHKDR